MILNCSHTRLDLSVPRIMGIVNVTPDSFSDGGLYAALDAAVAHARSLIAAGADIVDIGGESTRPGAQPVPVQVEMERVVPVVQALRGSGAVVSVDTRKPEVMRAALAAGAAMVNDIQALRAAGALEALATSEAAVCLMHMQGDPQTMQQQPRYGDVVAEVHDFLAGRIAAAEAAGIARQRIAIDPGFGFGKTLQDNLKLLRHLDRFTDLGVPVLAGLSRKSMLGAITGRAVDQRESAGLAAHVLAVLKGARIVRVHDVAACRDALRVIHAVEECE